MKKIRLFVLSLFSALTVLFACPVSAFASSSIEFVPSMASPTWNFYVSNVNPYFANLPDYVKNGNDILAKPGSGAAAYTCDFSGTVECYSNASISGGYSYSGTLGVSFNASFKSGSTSGDVSTYSAYGAVESVEFIIDGQSYSPFLTKTGLSKGTAYLTVKDLYVSASNRFIVRIHYRGYATYISPTPTINMYPTTGIYVGCTPSVVSAGESYKLVGTTSGFNDNINDFNNGMNSGSDAENSLTDKAFDDINAFEFKDINSDSSILSSLTFYSSVINLAYTSLGSTLQTLLAVSFGVLIVIFVLRIRRDTS